MVKQYDVYGIGAALLDTECRVSDQFLETAGIEKGVMTLVDEKRQSEILISLAARENDFVRKCGGSVCNSIVAAGLLGSDTFFSGKVADDADGNIFMRELTAAGVDFHSVKSEAGVTGKCLVMITVDAERTMNTFLGASAQLSKREIDDSALLNSEWLYIEGYLATSIKHTEMAADIIKFAKASSVKVALSLSDPFVVEAYADNLRQIIGTGVDHIFCNKAEAIAFTGTSNEDEAASDLCKYSISHVVTSGADGARCFDGEHMIFSQGIEVDAIDTNGAGDMFAGAFLFAITSGKSYQWAADFANVCASMVVKKFGPRLDKDDFEMLKDQYELR